MEDIVILVSSLHRLIDQRVQFLFTDRHAYLKTAQFSENISDLSWIIWDALRARNFKKDDVDKFEKYQAEALVYRHMPLEALLAILCYNENVRVRIQAMADGLKAKIKIVADAKWYL